MVFVNIEDMRRNLVNKKLQSLKRKEEMIHNSKKKTTGDKHLFFKEITSILGIEFNHHEHLSSGSTVQKQGLKDIFDNLNKDQKIEINKKTKHSYLEGIFELLDEDFIQETDTSGGSTITSWALFKIIRALQ